MDFRWIATKPCAAGMFMATPIESFGANLDMWSNYSCIELFIVSKDTIFINTKKDIDQLHLLVNLGLTREEINDYFSKE